MKKNKTEILDLKNTSIMTEMKISIWSFNSIKERICKEGRRKK